MSFAHLLSNNIEALKALSVNSALFNAAPFTTVSVTGTQLSNNLVNAIVCMSGANGSTVFLPTSTGLAAFLGSTGSGGMSQFSTSYSASGASFNFDVINCGAIGYISNNADANWTLVSAQASTPFTFPAVIAANAGKKCVVTKTGAGTFQLAVV